MCRRFQSKVAAWFLATAAMCLNGCETIGQDLSGLGGMLIPASPGQAARDMVDPHDADKRRQGTTLISGAHFGGLDMYLAQYRDMVKNERDPLALAAAVRALARHGMPVDAPLIAQTLKHSSVQVRWEAAKGLQRVHNPDVVPELLTVLRNDAEHQDVRVAAAVALAQYPSDRAFQGLVAALEARELALNQAAEQSLTTITGRTFDLDSRAWLAWYDSLPRDVDPFQQRRDFLYPTFHRPVSLLEKLAFWNPISFEQPSPPAGLRSTGERQTYDDTDDGSG